MDLRPVVVAGRKALSPIFRDCLGVMCQHCVAKMHDRLRWTMLSFSCRWTIYHPLPIARVCVAWMESFELWMVIMEPRDRRTPSASELDFFNFFQSKNGVCAQVKIRLLRAVESRRKIQEDGRELSNM